MRQLPYSVPVGATVGLSRALNEKLRTIPALAPLDIRIRPDIMESGMRTAVAVLRHRGIERIQELANNAKAAGRPLTTEEYSSIADIAKLPPHTKTSIVTMSDALNDLNEQRNKYKNSGMRVPDEIINEMNLLEQSIDNVIGRDIARANIPGPQSVPKDRQLKISAAKAGLPIYKPNKAAVERANALLSQMKGKKG
jgi:hypothetical protein